MRLCCQQGSALPPHVASEVDANIKKAATPDKRVPHVTSNGEMYSYRLLGR